MGGSDYGKQLREKLAADGVVKDDRRPAGYDDGRMRANDGSEEVRSLSPEQLMEAVAEAREEGPAP